MTMKKISQLAERNAALIKQLQTAKPINQKSYDLTYNPNQPAPSFTAKQNTTTVQVDKWLLEAPISAQMIAIKDIFKDKIDYSCKNFQDLVRLNEAMLPVAGQYELFGESPKAAEELGKFLKNFELLQEGLTKVQNQLDLAQQNSLEEINSQLEQVNNILESLHLTYKFNSAKRTDDSVIMSDSEAGQLRTWLRELNKTGNMRVLFRGSRDGFATSTFHQKCDNQGATVTVVKSTSGRIFGGFNPLSWNSSNGYSAAAGAFLFTLAGALPAKYTIHQNPTYAIYGGSGYGPTFGGGHDLYIGEGCNANTSSASNMPHTYGSGTSNTTLCGSASFTVADYEVLAVS
eukprot:TRINITY_DN1394_c0_g1::TRINITY_DN1394_c0_g1_i1::g.19999::m.19999 TRINITY_DN1394_c0_g1::TRINITY_DN1394_c0_g1_i1::g.19999  ORF type:complete len:366 (+),score=42.94,TLD/PF07534.11/5e-19,Sec20/PF03908.8/5.8e+03,Sec20/PF03908.8/11,Sec20/PF03908.8/34,Cytochrom_B562/PF07361.6/8.4e+03,Cytochrom_B562/PF07361.6/0.15,FliD_N/PF02465.13/3.1e+03,FliD_N/PF02465.13/0.78 TRINITY_DN1394_c0_g1_i1:65-1099(+)